MPSLNVVKYIRACVESVLAQTLQDIEILVIDAGSTDGTLEILQEYAETDSRVRVIHSDKKSYGYQLNIGIAFAQAEYIGIVETDDKIVSDMYETLYDVAVKTGAEYVKGRAEYFIEIAKDEEWNKLMWTPIDDERLMGEVISPREMPNILVKDIYLWTGIYRKKFIKKIKLNETSGAAFQDQGFLFQTISSARRAVYLDKMVYQYRQDNSSSSVFNRKGFHYLVEEYTYIEKFLKDKNEEWRRVYYQRMLNQCVERFRVMAISGEFWEEAFSDMEILRGRLLQAVEKNIIQSKDVDTLRWEMLKLFLSGAEEIYSYCVDKLKKTTNTILEIFQTIDNYKTVIFSSGRYGKFFHALLECKRPGLAVAYCDNNSELWNSEIQGMMVLSPDEAAVHYPDAVYVIANLRSTDVIKQQLRKLGIADEQICIYQEAPDLLLFKADL